MRKCQSLSLVASNGQTAAGDLWYNTGMVNSSRTATLSSKADYTIFSFGGNVIKFSAPYSLRRYIRVRKWHAGYLEVDADYGQGIEEDYIDLRPILRNLLVNPSRFLKPIENVEISYA